MADIDGFKTSKDGNGSGYVQVHGYTDSDGLNLMIKMASGHRGVEACLWLNEQQAVELARGLQQIVEQYQGVRS